MSSGEWSAPAFGRFRLLGVAGRGGMAVVYRAQTVGASGFSRPVALKQLLPKLVLQEDFVRLFVEEARVSARLDHPNIVQVHDFGTDAHGHYFLVLEWVEGLDLGRWLDGLPRGVKPEWTHVASLGLQILDALDFAHRHTGDAGESAPVIHRDISPGNILLGAHGHVKLADFGLARAMDRTRMTDEGVIKGKVSYVAPELAKGAEPSPRTDLFSLGATLWETLARRRLFDGPNDLTVLMKILREPIPKLASARPELPAALCAVIDKALAKAPDDRWPTARAMRRALVEVLLDARRLPEPLEIARTVAAARGAKRPPSEPSHVVHTPSLMTDLQALAPDDSDEIPFDLVPAQANSEPFELIPLIDPDS
ncbi:MAG: serine/threonine-protein kinase [Myxococcota bacterium]|nr:serine/threonine-protein kinase [Myxococcota bacterium]